MTDAAEVAELLADRPDLKTALQAALATDREHDNWTFDDIDIDSGSFGELVGRDIVISADEGGYQLANQAAVERALTRQISDNNGEEGGINFSPQGTLLDFDRVAAAGLALVLALVALLRVTSLPAVFRDRVVLSGNDPYVYRYWVNQLLVKTGGNLDLSVLSSLPSGIVNGEPLTVGSLWLVTTLLGGTQEVGGVVLAVYPVVSAIVTGALVYLLALQVSKDRRVALAAVAMLAVVPAHGLRTSLGFADHHAFDYPWLVITALGLVAVLGRESAEFRPRDAWPVLAVGIGVAAQVLAWEAGPLLVLPLGLAVAAVAPIVVREDRSLLPAGVPLITGLALAAVLAHLAHTSFGWQTNQVAYAPALLLVGAAGILGLAEGFQRTDFPALGVVGAEIIGAVTGIGLTALLLPEYWGRFTNQLGQLFSTQAVAEVQSLFTAPIGGLLLFGFVLVLALPYLMWGTIRGYRGDRQWLAIAVYGWYFLALAAIQVRFGGELTPFAAVFAGLGFVHIAQWVDIAAPPLPFRDERSFRDQTDDCRLPQPTRQQLGAVIVLFLLIGSLGIIQVPIKTSQLTIDKEQYETATWMAEQQTGDGPPYVFSEWGRNRMYNYYLSGDARSYSYARGNYERFLSARDEATWYERLQERAQFVVYTGVEGPEGSVAKRLAAYGSRTGRTPGLAHFRAVYISEDENYRVFTIVPGATITGSAAANATVEATTHLAVSDTTIRYERQVRAGPSGNYTVTVPYPGEYQVHGKSVIVPKSAVQNGTRLSANES
jgi:dolichyl-diphosphooligosaccharide--protein glycosyltransferase